MTPGRDPVLAMFEVWRRAHAGRGPAGPFDGTPSVYLWGTSRPTVNLVLFALARRTDPEFVWLDVQDRGSSEPLDHGLDRELSDPLKGSVRVRAEELLPQPSVAAASLSHLLRLDSDAGELARLKQFMALPAPVQAIAARSVPKLGPRVLAVPNSDLLADLYIDRPEVLRRIIQTLQELSISFLVGRADRPGPLRFVFDYVFEVRVPSLQTWDQGELVCERSLEPRSIPVGHAFPLNQLSGVADALGGAVATDALPDARDPAS